MTHIIGINHVIFNHDYTLIEPREFDGLCILKENCPGAKLWALLNLIPRS